MPGEFKPGWSGYDLPRIPGRWLKYAAAAVLVIILLATSVYQIKPEEIGVILRFGRFVRTTEPGLHIRLPLGIEKLTRVPVQRQLKLEFGYRTARPGVKSEYYVNEETKRESMMLTGDLNVVVAEWIVQYKIKDPYKFLFKVRDPIQTFRAMTEAVVRQVVGDASVDEVITFGRADLAAEAMTALQKLVDTYELGLEINQLIFQDVNPPDPVKPSFNEVNQALQEKERKINEAWAEYNKEIPKAQGEAEQMIRGAEGYAAERVNNARGDAARFISIYQEYSKAPAVTRKRLYLETLTEVLAGIDKKIIVDEAQKNLVPLLNLDQEVKK